MYLFAGITGDYNYMHIDAPKSEKGIFGDRVAHGVLISGFISTVIGMYLPGPGTIYLQQSTNFLLPVKIGDTVTAMVEVAEVVNREKRIFKLSTCVKNQRDEIVLTGEAIVKAPAI